MSTTNGEFERQVRDFWTEHPHDYHVVEAEPSWSDFRNVDRKVLKLHSPWAHERYPLLHKLVPYEELRGRRVLDLGCGTGWALEQFVRAGAEVVGLDLSRTHVGWSRRRLEQAGCTARLIEGDGQALPFPAGSFDYVLAWGVVMHAADPARLAGEIRRVLRPGGRAGVMLYHKNSLHWRWSIYFMHGILGLERLRRPAAEIFRRHTNNPELGGSPVARAYSRRGATELFGGFRSVEVQVHDLERAMGYFPSRRVPLLLVLPAALRRRLARRIGFHLWLDLVR